MLVLVEIGANVYILYILNNYVPSVLFIDKTNPKQMSAVT